MTTNEAFLEAMRGGTPRVGIFFRLGLTPRPFRMWLGVGDCRAGIDAKDFDGATYYGLGEMLNVPSFQQLVNGAADRTEFHVSGVSQRLAEVASGEAGDVKNVPLYVGVAAFSQAWQLLAQPTWIRRFTVDYLSLHREQSRSGNGDVRDVRTISLSVRTAFTGRRRPKASYFLDADQQALSSGDRFCERAGLYTVDATKVWPRF